MSFGESDIISDSFFNCILNLLSFVKCRSCWPMILLLLIILIGIIHY